MREKTMKADINFYWTCSSLLATVNMIEFHTTEAYSNLDLTKLEYNIYKHSREENVKVME
jgi:hypothetical protein